MHVYTSIYNPIIDAMMLMFLFMFFLFNILTCCFFICIFCKKHSSWVYVATSARRSVHPPLLRAGSLRIDYRHVGDAYSLGRSGFGRGKRR